MFRGAAVAFWQSDQILGLPLYTVYHFWIFNFSGRVPSWAAASFFKSPMVSSSLHFTRTFFPSRSFKTTSIMIVWIAVGDAIELQTQTLIRQIFVSRRIRWDRVWSDTAQSFVNDCRLWSVSQLRILFHGKVWVSLTVQWVRALSRIPWTLDKF